MIIVRAIEENTIVENNFEDKDAFDALEYKNMLEENGWTKTQWIHLPDLTFEQYIKNYLKELKMRT